MSKEHEITTDDILQMLESCRPSRRPGTGPDADFSIAGMGHIIRILSDAANPVTSGELSRGSGVSTARIAVLLRKLEEKGLVTRSGDPKDARKTLVSLTAAGKVLSEKKKAEFRAMLQEVIDRIGEERLQDYIETTREISAIAEKNFRTSVREDNEMFTSGKGENNT